MRLLLWILAAWVLTLALILLLTTDNTAINYIDPQPNLTEGP